MSLIGDTMANYQSNGNPQAGTLNSSPSPSLGASQPSMDNIPSLNNNDLFSGVHSALMNNTGTNNNNPPLGGPNALGNVLNPLGKAGLAPSLTEPINNTINAAKSLIDSGGATTAAQFLPYPYNIPATAAAESFRQTQTGQPFDAIEVAKQTALAASGDVLAKGISSGLGKIIEGVAPAVAQVKGIGSDLFDFIKKYPGQISDSIKSGLNKFDIVNEMKPIINEIQNTTKQAYTSAMKQFGNYQIQAGDVLNTIQDKLEQRGIKLNLGDIATPSSNPDIFSANQNLGGIKKQALDKIQSDLSAGTITKQEAITKASKITGLNVPTNTLDKLNLYESIQPSFSGTYTGTDSTLSKFRNVFKDTINELQNARTVKDFDAIRQKIGNFTRDAFDKGHSNIGGIWNELSNSIEEHLPQEIQSQLKPYYDNVLSTSSPIGYLSRLVNGTDVGGAEKALGSKFVGKDTQEADQLAKQFEKEHGYPLLHKLKLVNAAEAVAGNSQIGGIAQKIASVLNHGLTISGAISAIMGHPLVGLSMMGIEALGQLIPKQKIMQNILLNASKLEDFASSGALTKYINPAVQATLKAGSNLLTPSNTQ